MTMPESKNRKPRRNFTEEFKSQIVLLYQNGKRKCDIVNEYNLAPSLLDKWIKQAESTGSFKEKDNRTPEEQEVLELHKRIKQLEMENDILKQAALILGRK
jgi:transposase